MTSVVDKYYRRIIQNIDNVRMKFDIRALLCREYGILPQFYDE